MKKRLLVTMLGDFNERNGVWKACNWFWLVMLNICYSRSKCNSFLEPMKPIMVEIPMRKSDKKHLLISNVHLSQSGFWSTEPNMIHALFFKMASIVLAENLVHLMRSIVIFWTLLTNLGPAHGVWIKKTS